MAASTLLHINKIKKHLNDMFSLPEASSIVFEEKTKNLCNWYETLSKEEKTNFLTTLAFDFGCNQTSILAAANQLKNMENRGMLRAEEKLRQTLTPKYQRLFSEMGRLENGVKFLVDIRADMLQLLKEKKEDSHLQAMNIHLRRLLSLWFSVGFLHLERLTWASPCDMLQKISEYEAVHPIRSWADLKRRVGPYRRCFVFTHKSMPREPIVVLHTALTNEISDSIKKIVTSGTSHTEEDGRVSSIDDVSTVENPAAVSTAIFYSITSTQIGLQGVELGNYLIKHAVKELGKEFPNMHQFSSLSPIPGFNDWLTGEINKYLNKKEIGNEIKLLTNPQLSVLLELFPNISDEKEIVCAFKSSLKNNNWIKNESLCLGLKKVLMPFCARYLYVEKRRGYALNAVANFHLRNGAVMWRINWMADTTPRGLNSSFGIMVNYRYYLHDTYDYSKQYTANKYINASESVLELVKDQLVTSHI